MIGNSTENGRQGVHSIGGMLGFASSAEELMPDEEKEYRDNDGNWRCRKCGEVTIGFYRLSFSGREGWLRQRCACRTDEERAREKAAEEAKKEADRVRLHRLKTESGIVPRYFDAHLDDIECEGSESVLEATGAARLVVESPDAFLRSGRGIYFYGSVGLGKTLIASALANELIEKGYSVMFVDFGSVFASVKESWSSGMGESEYRFMKKAGEVEFLIIDDFCQDRLTTNKGLPTWKRDFIIQFINKRYNAMKPTFFTSNNGIEQLSATGCPEAAIDRIREMVVAECLLVGASYRLRKSQELSAEMRELLFGREG